MGIHLRGCRLIRAWPSKPRMGASSCTGQSPNANCCNGFGGGGRGNVVGGEYEPMKPTDVAREHMEPAPPAAVTMSRTSDHGNGANKDATADGAQGDSYFTREI